MATPVWSDEFDGPAASAPDPTKWTYDLGNQDGFGNNELQVYTDSRANSFIDGNSHLVIRALDEGGGNFTSARLKTLGLFDRVNGTWEARIKLSQAPGTWPAWWLLGSDIAEVGWPACGEVDMLEWYGNGEWAPTTAVHVPSAAGQDASIHTVISVDNRWHVWKVWWNVATNNFVFYKDSKQYFKVKPSQLPSWPFTGKPLFTILNVAVGGTGGGSPSGTKFPVDMLVDYVRVYDGTA